MTSPSSSQPAIDPIVLEQLRRRSFGDDADSLEWARSFVASPLAVGIGRVLGLDVAPLRDAMEEAEQNLRTVAASMVFAERGWAPSGTMALLIYHAAVRIMANGGTIEEAEEALVNGWNDQSHLSMLRHRVLGLGFRSDDEVAGWYRERGRLAGRAWEHHVAGAYEASVPILFAQIDGITADATLPPKGRGGKMFFSPSGSKYVDVVDDATLAGMNAALPVARQHFMTEIRGTAVRGSLSRHGVMHGRELGYDTKANSTKTFVLLAAVVEWAQPRIRAEIGRRRVKRDEQYAGTNATDAEGDALDRRGFVATRSSLRALSFAQAGFWRDHGRYAMIKELLRDVVSEVCP